MNRKKIRVLVVDDSMVFREVIARGLQSDPELEVVARAVDPFDARDKLLEYEPDVMTCDVEMPKMNGIEFLKRLLPQYRIPVIVVSGVNEAVFDALNAGAVDFVEKPDVQSPKSVEAFLLDMISKIKIAAGANLTRSGETGKAAENTGSFNSGKLVAIGASTGGTEALFSILKQLPSNVPGIVIVQHIPPLFSKMFADRLNTQTSLNVKEASSGDYLEQGRVLVAPGDKHISLRKVGSRYMVEAFEGNKINGHCPSVDVLFESVAKSAGRDAVGVILTGMGYDGARGLLAMRRKGARTIGQDEKSCVVYGMPKVAFEVGAVEKQAALADIPKLLLSMLL